MREYFRKEGIHDYSDQEQGQEHKKLVDTYILNSTEQFYTKTSLYRPLTKKGDPRLWVNRVKNVDFLQANDIFIFIAQEKILYAINITHVNIPEVCSGSIDTPLKDLVYRISKLKSSVSDELLQLIEKKMTNWMPSVVLADTGIGRTIETVLGIPMNASKNPDYKGIELKSHREETKVRNTLFTQTPNWNLSRFKSGRAIVDCYGYIPEGGTKKTLQVTLSARKPNSQNLGLKVMQNDGILEVDEFCLKPDSSGIYRKINDVAIWELGKLHDRLLTKHHETFWIDVETMIKNGNEYFRCSKIQHTKNPIISQFDILLDQGDITVDFLLCRPSGHGDTYSFKIKQKARSLLFPKSETHIF